MQITNFEDAVRVEQKKCTQCHKGIIRDKKLSLNQWNRRKFCSVICQRLGRIRTTKTWNKGLRTAVPRKCDVCETVSTHVTLYRKWGKLLCGKHYWHFRIYGKVHERNHMTPNEIVGGKRYSRLILYNRHGQEVASAFFDNEFTETIRHHKWSVKDSYGYVRNKDGKYMHHMILPKKLEFVVDHISGDTFDNRQKNLRYLTHSENLRAGYARKRALAKGKESEYWKSLK